MDTAEAAWAAGFFDAEGSVLIRDQQGRLRRELAVSQAGHCGAPPSVLMRFRGACDGRGTIRGPRRGYLYYWRVGSTEDVDAVGAQLIPWLSDPKRTQLLRAGERAGRPVSSLLIGPFAAEHDLAWAAGFFGGDGTVAASRSGPGPARYLSAVIAQAGASGRPEVLSRFERALGGAGAIRGPFMPNNPWSRQPQYAWHLGGSLAVESVLESLWPWLHEEKRAQALRAIVAARATGPHRPMPPVSDIFGLA